MENLTWVMLAVACDMCGGEVAVSICDREPDDNDVLSLKDELGGMRCIRVWIKQVERGEVARMKECGALY